MKPSHLSISVVICAYTEERWTDLLEAVQSVSAQTSKPGEIIVVIDHNPDLLTRAQKHLSAATVIANCEPRGLSGARNSGVAAAKGDIIAFLDEDAVAAEDWLAQLMSYYADQGVLGVGGAILPRWKAAKPRWFPEEFNWVVGCTYRGMPESVSPVRNLIGCNMSFRRYLFDEIGGFRNGMGRIGTLPIGCEETELCIRAGQRWPGHVLLFVPQARVYHTVPVHRGHWNYFRSRCYAEGQSKAQVAAFVGRQDGLSNERQYTLHTLPSGVIQGLVDALIHFDWHGIGRSAAIMSGLLVTAAGYLVGSMPRQALRSGIIGGKRPLPTTNPKTEP
jgi:glucosyl-dolichyl phosphate glucuronosyltransferase